MNITAGQISTGRSLKYQAESYGLELILNVKLTEGVLVVLLYKKGGNDLYYYREALEEANLDEAFDAVQKEINAYVDRYEQRRRQEIERMRAEVAAYDKEQEGR
ncbi:MAG: hypothetical protein IKE76_09395 [Clostridia bacterium]|nr:hypothetical protein [Clostridia bacterium]